MEYDVRITGTKTRSAIKSYVGKILKFDAVEKVWERPCGDYHIGKSCLNNNYTYEYVLPDVGSMYPTKITFNYGEPAKPLPTMDRIIFSGPCTITFWSDGDKTIVRQSPDDTYDPEKAFLVSYFQKVSGLSKTQSGKFLEEIVEKYKEQCPPPKKVVGGDGPVGPTDMGICVKADCSNPESFTSLVDGGIYTFNDGVIYDWNGEEVLETCRNTIRDFNDYFSTQLIPLEDIEDEK